MVNSPHPNPNWQPVSQLPLLASVIDGVLAGSQKQYQTFLSIQDGPHVLDDALVSRVINAYTTQRDGLWLYEEQLARWLAEPLTAAQRQEVTRLKEQLPRIQELSQAILGLMEKMKGGTIDQVLGSSDLEVGLDFLMKKRKK
jgi:hypothetical protein